jgi:NAD(P)-dependent dehydrogenase (short-subunit alcohol dehydrogenase family)
MLTPFLAISEETGCKALECWTVDLTSFKSVSAFVDRFEKEGGGRLDILLENAGILSPKFVPTTDGWESTLVSIAAHHR